MLLVGGVFVKLKVAVLIDVAGYGMLGGGVFVLLDEESRRLVRQGWRIPS